MNSSKPVLFTIASLLCTLSLDAASLSLSEAYALALQNHHGYKSKQLENDSSAFALRQREARLYPQAQLSLSGGLHDYVQNYDRYTEVSEFYKSYSVSASQAIYHPEFLASIAQGKLQSEGLKAETLKTSQDLGVDVAQAYVDLSIARGSLELARANHRFYSLKYTMIAQMLSEGLSNKMDLLDTQIYRDRAQLEILAAEKKELLSRKKLESLIQVPVEGVYGFAADLRLEQTAALTESESLDQSPELQVAALSRQIAEREIAIRNYDHYPKVDLSLSRTENDTSDRVMYKTDNRAFVQVSIPLYQGGMTAARVDEARLLHLSAAEKESQTREELRIKAEQLIEEYDLYVRNLAILKTAREAAALNLSAVEAAQKAGLKNMVDVLEARMKLHRIDQDRLKQIGDLATNRVTFFAQHGALNADTLGRMESSLFAATP